MFGDGEEELEKEEDFLALSRPLEELQEEEEVVEGIVKELARFGGGAFARDPAWASPLLPLTPDCPLFFACCSRLSSQWLGKFEVEFKVEEALAGGLLLW